MSIGARIEKRRMGLQMSQERLAERMRVPVSVVEEWEKETTLPDVDQIAQIAKVLDTKISWLFGEERVGQDRWVLHDAVFSIDRMLAKVTNYASERQMSETLKAIAYMQEYHKGQKRKGREQIPYIIHPLIMACHAFALEIGDDNLVAACLLHDVIEDCDVTAEELDIAPEILEAVELVSFSEIEGLSRQESKKIYYEKIGKNKIASMVKILDRCNNVSGMVTGFTKERIADYIDETETYIMPILDIVKHTYPEYYDAAFLLKYHMVSVMESLKWTI